jgi:hypothetical protein
MQKLEQSLDPIQDGPGLTELKRIVLLRIAELEASNALQPADVKIADAPAQPNLPQSLVLTESEESLGPEALDSAVG